MNYLIKLENQPKDSDRDINKLAKDYKEFCQ